MGRVLIISYHGIGHLNPFFSISRMLEPDHEVTISAAEFFTRYVTEQGHEFAPLSSVPFAMNFESWVARTSGKRNLYLAEFRFRLTNQLYHERKSDLTSLLESVNPEIVLIDAMLTTDFIVLYPLLKSRVRVGVVHTMLPTETNASTPTVDSFIASDDPNDIANANAFQRSSQTNRHIRQWLKFIGHTDRYLIEKELNENQIPMKFRSQSKGLLNFYTQNIPEIVLAPREFDFEFVTRPGKEFAGFLPSVQKPRAEDKAYIRRRRDIMHLKLNSGAPVVYCAFGTAGIGNKDHIRSFLSKLIAICCRTNMLVVISSGLDLSVSESIPNIFIFKSVYQIDLLEITDVFITHGGLNSIAEAIHHEVPLLVYPINDRMDARGNAARVAYHQIGLIGDLNRDGEDTILLKVNELWTNPLYKKNLKIMRESNEQYSDRLRDLIAKLPLVE